VRDKASGEIRHCLFRQNLGQIACGDRVIWQPVGERDGVVTALLHRSSVLSRRDFTGRGKPLAANLTQLVVVVAPEPKPNEYLIDQYLVTAELIGVSAMIAVNKTDLLSPKERQKLAQSLAHYPRIGYPLLFVSAVSARGLDELVAALKAHTSILVGQSGVGKSSLVRSLLPDQDVQVGHLSEATGHGRHTTSTTKLYRLPQGGELIDSPGVRSFRLLPTNQKELEQAFREFRDHLGKCKFSDCGHDHEPECSVRDAVSAGLIDPRRLESFLQFGREICR